MPPSLATSVAAARKFRSLASCSLPWRSAGCASRSAQRPSTCCPNFNVPTLAGQINSRLLSLCTRGRCFHSLSSSSSSPCCLSCPPLASSSSSFSSSSSSSSFPPSSSSSLPTFSSTHRQTHHHTSVPQARQHFQPSPRVAKLQTFTRSCQSSKDSKSPALALALGLPTLQRRHSGSLLTSNSISNFNSDPQRPTSEASGEGQARRFRLAPTEEDVGCVARSRRRAIFIDEDGDEGDHQGSPQTSRHIRQRGGQSDEGFDEGPNSLDQILFSEHHYKQPLQQQQQQRQQQRQQQQQQHQDQEPRRWLAPRSPRDPEPDQQILKRPLATVVADGWTPYQGKVTNITEFGVFVDFGCEHPGLLPRSGSQAVDSEALGSLNLGDEITVYVTVVSRDTGKINLSLTPNSTPQTRIWSVLADGRTPYEGVVVNHTSFGTFFDIGAECPALLPAISDEETMPIGSKHTIYVVAKRGTAGRLACSLHPAPIPKNHLRNLVVDGRTPYRGVVKAFDPNVGAFIDIGCESSAIIPLSGEAFGGLTNDADRMAAEEEVRELEIGQEVTVYVIAQTRHNNKTTVSLKPTPKKLIPWEAMVCDGQTKVKARVVNRTSWGTFFNIGCAQPGLMPASQVDNQPLYDSLQIGQTVPVYVHTKCRRTGKISLRLNRAKYPRERWEAIVTDGQFPYQGKVIGRSWHGLFVDIGAEQHGLVKATNGLSKHPALSKYKIGDELTVYVTEKKTDSGHITLSLDRCDEPLLDWMDLIADGQTKYPGKVTFVSGNGALVNVGANRIGLIPKGENRNGLAEGCTAADLKELQIGQDIDVYLVRRNLAAGRLVFSLHPTPTPRLALEDVLADTEKTYRGIVYNLDYHYAHLDFGCETAALLERSSAPSDLLVGRAVFVKILDFDDDSGKVLVDLARPNPPPRPSKSRSAGA